MNLEHQAIALAGTFQAVSLARSAACRGTMDLDPLEASIGSLYQLDPGSIEAIYGGLEGLELGLQTLVRAFRRESDQDTLAHVAALLMLEKRLQQRQDLQLLIRQSILESERQAEHLGRTHGTVLNRLGELYLHTISTMKPRLVVHGKPLYLQQPQLVGSIRAALLAGVRSAVLWSQVGGSRMKLVFRRRILLRSAEQLLNKIA